MFSSLLSSYAKREKRGIILETQSDGQKEEICGISVGIWLLLSFFIFSRALGFHLWFEFLSYTPLLYVPHTKFWNASSPNPFCFLWMNTRMEEESLEDREMRNQAVQDKGERGKRFIKRNVEYKFILYICMYCTYNGSLYLCRSRPFIECHGHGRCNYFTTAYSYWMATINEVAFHALYGSATSQGASLS